MGLFTNTEKVLLVPDIHADDHDKKAIDVAAQIHSDYKPDRVIFLGDFVDSAWAGTFKKDSERLVGQLERELTAWEGIRKLFPAKKVQVIPGNHERRIWDWKWDNPGLAKWKPLEPPALFRLGDAEWVEEGYIRLAKGKFTVTHGRYARAAPCSSARAEMNFWGTSGASAHNHRMEKYYKRDNARLMMWASSGHLSNNPPHYVDLNHPGATDWVQGVVALYIEGDRFDAVDIPFTMKHRAHFNGRNYKG